MSDTVLLLNFGGPSNASEVESFLRNLFEDPFIIRQKMPVGLRAFIANKIAKKRTAKATAEYQEIGFSPINRMTDIQAEMLRKILEKERPGVQVKVINRYTAPFAKDVVRELNLESGRLFLLTFYPHLCHSTTVSSLRDFDLAVMERCQRLDVPSTRVFSWWHHPRYLALTGRQLETGLQAALASGDGQPITVVFSAHGLPKRYAERGDPYVTETYAHAQQLQIHGENWLKKQGVADSKRVHWQVSFQSRVGPVEWIRPYTDEVLEKLGKERGGHLVVFPISFTADHIETLYEMDHTYRELALASGFKSFHRVKPANDDPELARCFAELLFQHGL